MAHGYMRDFDEDNDRDQMRDYETERGNQRNREFMMGDRDRNFDRGSNLSDSRSRSPWNDAREWFGGDRSPSQRAQFSNQDDHYRSWRDKQMQALDRDYADYCRERERQFHSDFDTWRSQRSGNVQPLQTGMTQTSTGTDPEGTLDLTNSLQTSSQSQPAMADAAVGTAPSRNRR